MTASPPGGTRLWLGLLCVAFVALSLAFNVTVPLYEGPDETFHFFYVKQLAGGHGLPVITDPLNPGLLGPEAMQAPLYYLTGALVAGRIDMANAEELLWYNPQGNRGNPARPGNKNIVVHTDAEAWPYRNTALAVHVLRGLSLLAGLATVVGTFLTARRLLRDERLALAAAGLNAFIPQFVFSSALVSNDLMITALCVWGLYLLLRLVERPGDMRLAAVLGGVLGLAALAKLSGVLLIALAGAALAWVAWRRRDERAAALRALVLIGVLAALIAGWWYVRNLLLYGDPTGESVWRAVTARDDKPIQWWSEFTGLRWSFWGLFGWFSILLPEWIYRALDALTVAALAGLAWRAWRARAHGIHVRWLLVVAWLVLMSISLVHWNTVVEGFQGRLMFPAISAICVLLVTGWASIPPVPLGTNLPRLVVAGMGLLTALVPPLVLSPAYARPPVVEALPADAVPVGVTYEDRIVLLGYRVETRAAGTRLPVTFYWRATRGLDRDYTLAVQALGQDYRPVGKLDSYPGAGAFPTSLWTPGQIVADRYELVLEDDARRPVLLVLSVTWYDGTPEAALSADPPGILLDAAKLAPANGGTVTGDLAPVRFGSAIELAGYRFAQDAAGLHVILQWRALSRPDDDYTVFVHVLAADGSPAGGADGEPLAGRYPTRWWDAGELIEDDHVVATPLASGQYTVRVGLYRPSDGVRLPVMTAAGEPAGTDSFVLPGMANVTASLPDHLHAVYHR